MGSRDPQIANYNIILVIGQKWRLDEKVKNLETGIFIQKVVGQLPVGRSSPGLQKRFRSLLWVERSIGEA